MCEGKGFIMQDDHGASGGDRKMPAVDFSTFILSLYSTALVQLGEIEDPATGAKGKNLDLGRQTIDMIVMLEKKTRGNLDNDEANLVKSLVHEVRLAYVRAKG
ncbi:MAG: DUF1844 domain-containing protein [Desulfobacterium sp.]|jgi:hypothetical protein|nr:DUF1844 domain-containing protein [Desulfobacterium sp.]